MKISQNGILLGCIVLLIVSCGDTSSSCSAPPFVNFDLNEKVNYLITDSNGRTDDVSITLGSDGIYDYTVNGNTEKINFSAANACSYPTNLTGFKRLFLSTQSPAIELTRTGQLSREYTEQECNNKNITVIAGDYPVYGCSFKNNNNSSTVNFWLHNMPAQPARGVILYEWRDGDKFIRAELSQWNNL